MQNTLQLYRSYLIKQGEESDKELSANLRRQEELSDSLITLKAAIEKTEKVIETLNSDRLEKLDTNGAIERQHSDYKFPHRTRDFVFELRTTSPIRFVDPWKDKKSSKWVNEKGGKGELYYSVALKNRFYSSATARVFLYGLPREIHADELKSMRLELKRLLANQTKAISDLEKERHDKSKLHVMSTAYEIMFDRYNLDERKVESFLTANTVDSKRLQKYIEADSVYGLGKLLELQSVVPNASKIVVLTDTGSAQALLCGQRVMFNAMKDYMNEIGTIADAVTSRRELRELSFAGTVQKLGRRGSRQERPDNELTFQRLMKEVLKATTEPTNKDLENQSVQSEDEIIGSLGGKRSHHPWSSSTKRPSKHNGKGSLIKAPPVQDVKMQDSIDMGTAPSVKEMEDLRSRCQETLTAVEKEFALFREKNQASFEILRKERAELFGCGEEIQIARVDLAFDSRATEAAMKMSHTDGLEVGAVAALLEMSEKSDAVASIWRGKRLELLEASV